MPENIFVLGLDELNLETLGSLPHLSQYRFHSLLDVVELTEAEEIDLAGLLDKAERQLEAFDGSVDAIVGYWDFPVTAMVPILCKRFGLPSAPLDAVVKCEHKYWSRLEQRQVIDAYPPFGLVDLDNSPEPPPGVEFPMWLKPVNSTSSMLAYHVHDRGEFDRAVAAIRGGIDRIGAPFDYLLSMLELPPEIAQAGGRACLAEQTVSGQQCTVEGYVRHGQVYPYGVIDSISYPGTSSFWRYQYPSQLPTTVSTYLMDLSIRVIDQLGLDGCTFNIEYFWDPDTDAINLLEVNPRHSQSHAKLFESVDGIPNHQAMIRLALGQDPELPYHQGEHAIAAKCFLRHFHDGVIRRMPTADEIARIERDLPGVTIELIPDEGDRLSDLPGQDSYSYELADIFIGAQNQDDLLDTYQRCVQSLHFTIDD